MKKTLLALIIANEARGLAVVASMLAGLHGAPAQAQNSPLSGLPPRGTVQGTDIIPIMPAGGAQLEQTTVSALLAGTGTGSGSVTNVGLAMPAYLSCTGGPITSAGTISCSLVSQSANTVFAGPASGSAAAPTWRALATADLPASGVTPGAYASPTSVTVNTAGQVTAITASTGALGTAKQEIEYFYGPAVLGKSTGSAGSLAANIGAGNGIADVHGGVWSVANNSLILSGTTDTTNGTQYLRDWGTLPTASTPSGLSQTMVFDLDATDAANVFAVFRISGTNTGYFVGTSNGSSGGGSIIYAYNAGTQVTSSTGASSGFATGHTLRVTASVTGSSPTVVTEKVVDLTTGAVISTATLSDSTTALQTATNSAIAIGNSAGAASAQVAAIDQIAIYDPTVASKPMFVAFVGDSITYGQQNSDAATNGGTIIGNNSTAQAVAALGPNWGAVNLGSQAARADQTASSIAERLTLLHSLRQQEWASVMSSINDAAEGYTAAQMEAKIIDLAGAIRAAGFRAMISTIIPLGSGCTIYNSYGTTPAGINAVLATFNAWVRANWASFADAITDPAADSRLSAYSATYWDADQLHMNDAGAVVLGGIWSASLSAAAAKYPQLGPQPSAITVAPADGAVNTVIAIPAGYTDFTVTVRGASKASAAFDTVNLQFNGDTGANYNDQQIVFNNTTSTSGAAAAQSSASIGWLPAATGISNGASQVTATVAGYGGSTYIKTVTSQSGVRLGTTTGSLYEQVDWADWNNPAPIVTMTVNVPGGLKASGSITVRMLP